MEKMSTSTTIRTYLEPYIQSLHTHLDPHTPLLTKIYLTTTILLSVLLISVSLHAFIEPVGFAANFGLPIHRPRKPSRKSAATSNDNTATAAANAAHDLASTRTKGWIQAWAIREFTLGVAVLGLRLAGEYRGLAILAACCGAVGWIDGLVAWRYGVDVEKSGVYGHLIPTFGFGWVGPLGVWLYLVN